MELLMTSLSGSGGGSPSKGDEHLVLRDVNFRCRSGDLVCIVGSVGCGKTTLIHSILGEAVRGALCADPLA